MILEVAVTATILCSNYNYQHSERCTAPPANIEVHDWGFDGYLESGVYWSQIKISDELHYFKMEDVEYFISNNNIIYIDGNISQTP